ncbi:MAG: hypothetical protein Q7J32_09920 [Sphingomonadaceae bacterium]|nr:hypothetical protein [Sphingomonadaceae bacterium]
MTWARITAGPLDPFASAGVSVAFTAAAEKAGFAFGSAAFC